MARPHRLAPSPTGSRSHDPAGAPSEIRIRLLGEFEVSVAGRALSPAAWRLSKARSLVQLLALVPSHRLHRDQVMDQFWPHLDARSAAGNFYQVLHAARRAFETVLPPGVNGARVVSFRRQVVALDPLGPLWIDVSVFKATVAIARRSGTLAAYKAALDLYRGDLLPEHSSDEWVSGERASLRDMYLSVLLEQARLLERRGYHVEAADAFRRVVDLDAAREEAHAGLMRLYALAGRWQEALQQYRILSDVLQRELETQPDPGTRRLYDDIRTGRFPPSPLLPPRPDGAMSEEPQRSNLPIHLTRFIGRDREIDEVIRLLETTRLFTLTGEGGSGKTRLALEVAERMAGNFPDGVWLVDLAALADPDHVPEAVAAAVGVPAEPGRPLLATLCGALRARRLLLILDNCEHVLAASARLAADLLHECPGLRILATSREPLRVAGEVIWQVPLLDVRGLHPSAPVDLLARNEAVALFVDRARLAQPSFALTPATAHAVAEICLRLDGMPLAIELAAARVAVLGVDQIASRLDQALNLLSAGSRTARPRQQTLRATLDWSYDLLTGSEQTVLRRLAVFAGGWDLAAAEVVVAGDGIASSDVLGLLFQLAIKSLVRVDRDEANPRYRLLETVRQYAWARLEEAGETERARRIHAEYYRQLAETAEPLLEGRDQAEWLERLETEHDNLRAALDWCASRNSTVEIGLRLATAIREFWEMRGYASEGGAWIDRLLANTRPSQVTPRLWIKALYSTATLAREQGDLARTENLCDQSLSAARMVDDRVGIAFSLTNLGIVARRRGEFERAYALHEEALRGWRDLGEPSYVAWSLTDLALTALGQGRNDVALSHAEESLAAFRALGHTWGTAEALQTLGRATHAMGDLERAQAFLIESLDAFSRLGSRRYIADGLSVLASVILARGDANRAARLLGAATALRDSIGASQVPEDHSRTEALAREQVDTAAFARAFEDGYGMSLDEAITLAKGTGAQPPSRPAGSAGRAGPERLTERERQVTRLVTEGLTSRQIAAELGIGVRTVDTHVGQILNKLGLTSRIQLAAWAARTGVFPPPE